MKRTAPQLLRRTVPVCGGGDNPYIAYAKHGPPGHTSSLWQAQNTIRNPVDGKWAPTRYGGDEYPSWAEFLVNFNEGHPVIEPLYHSRLTHKQKIVRLYKRCLREAHGTCLRIPDQQELMGFYHRQIRAEFEKNRDVDPGTAEWLFVRAINFVENRKPGIALRAAYNNGEVTYARYARRDHPDEFATFPHGFDPEEAYKLMNPYHRFGIPYLGKTMHLTPHTYMMRPWHMFRPSPLRVFVQGLWYTFSALFVCMLLSHLEMGGFAAWYPGHTPKSTLENVHESRPLPTAQSL